MKKDQQVPVRVAHVHLAGAPRLIRRLHVDMHPLGRELRAEAVDIAGPHDDAGAWDAVAGEGRDADRCVAARSRATSSSSGWGVNPEGIHV